MIRAGGVTVVVDEAAIQRLLASPNGPVGRELARIGARVEGRAKQLLSGEMVNVQTGRLRSSTTWRLFTRGGMLGVAIGSGAYYGEFVHRRRPYLAVAGQDVLGPSLI